MQYCPCLTNRAPNRTTGKWNTRALSAAQGRRRVFRTGTRSPRPGPCRSGVHLRDPVTVAFITALLWLFVINLGIAMGAGLYESQVVMPDWANLAREAWPNTGLKFWAFVTHIPLTLLTFLSLWPAWQSGAPERVWWRAAAVVIVVERVATFGYFIPRMIAMQGGSGVPDAQGKAASTQWLWFNAGHHALTLVGWLLALRAMVLRG